MQGARACSYEVGEAGWKRIFAQVAAQNPQMVYFAAFCECLMWLQFLFVLVAQSRQTKTSVDSKPLMVVVCVGSPPQASRKE